MLDIFSSKEIICLYETKTLQRIVDQEGFSDAVRYRKPLLQEVMTKQSTAPTMCHYLSVNRHFIKAKV